MVNFSLSGKLIMSFVHKMSEQYQLNDEQSDTLKNMIDKMCNFCGESPAEVRRANTPQANNETQSSWNMSGAWRKKLEGKAKQMKQVLKKSGNLGLSGSNSKEVVQEEADTKI
jgi:hypothetical protein